MVIAVVSGVLGTNQAQFVTNSPEIFATVHVPLSIHLFNHTRSFQAESNAVSANRGTPIKWHLSAPLYRMTAEVCPLSENNYYYDYFCLKVQRTEGRKQKLKYR